MKFWLLTAGCFGVGSPPARGAWIEIVADGGKNILPPESPPARGAWIEILPLPSIHSPMSVAPRTGGVD